VICRPPLKDLNLHGLNAVLPAQSHQLGAFVAVQTLLHTLIDVDLTHPVAQARIRDPQVTGDLSDRLPAQPSQLDRTTTKLVVTMPFMTHNKPAATARRR
jgi:hypothetical protein